MKRVALHNLGCKVNAYEIDIMQQMLVENGYEIVPFDTTADIYIVNTCTVTNIADRKSRQMLHQAKTRNPEAIVVAVGCYVQTGDSDALLKDGVDLAIGNNRKKDMVEILEKFLKERENGKNPESREDTSKQESFSSAYVPDMSMPCDYEEMTLTTTAEHCRAYIKIQDGCNQFCSYCIIPYARGRVRSRRWEDIYAEIEGIAKRGYKEIVLTGIHISSYGIDFDEDAWRRGESVVKVRENGIRDYAGRSRLIDLLEKINGIEGIERIRLSSLEPRIITVENVERMAKIDKLCPHFHLSLQSGNDETLKRMNRHYTTGEYLNGVRLLRKAFGHPAITTDVIVGFPGETGEEFEETVEFLKEVNLYEMHIFRYSKRKGTKAAAMPHQVPGPVQRERSKVLFDMEAAMSREFRAFYVGREVEVLFEEAKRIGGKTYQIGHTREYVKVAKRSEESLANQIIRGRISDFLQEEVLLME